MRRPEICWKKIFLAELLGACAPWSVAFVFLRTLSVGGTPLHKLCTWLLLNFFFRRNFWRPLPLDRLQFFLRTMVFFVFRRNSTTQIMHLTSAEFFFFQRNSTSQNVRLSSADLYGFSAEVHKFSNRASLQHFLSLACYWPSCNGCNGRGLEWAWISGHWIQSMPRLIDGL